MTSLRLRPPATFAWSRLGFSPAALPVRESLFSVKTFCAAMMACWFAMWIGLDRPYWSIISAYITAQPLAGAVLSKGSFRAIGTVAGAAASVFLVILSAPSALITTLTISLWCAACTYASLLDRSPRGYAYVLAGYTAAIICFPAVLDPQDVFTLALDRAQEILIGIVCSILVHIIIVPVSTVTQLRRKTRAMLTDTRGWLLDTLRETAAPGRHWPEKLSLDLYDVHNLAMHLAFEVGTRAGAVKAVRAMQAQLSTIWPLIDGIGHELPRLDEAGRASIRELSDALQFTLTRPQIRPADWQALNARLGKIIAGGMRVGAWRDVAFLDIALRLVRLLSVYRQCLALLAQIERDEAGAAPPVMGGTLRTHRDNDLALRGALGTFAAVFVSAVLWMLTAWPDGGTAVIFAGIWTALFSSLDNGRRAVGQILGGTLVGSCLALAYVNFIIPAVTDFRGLSLCLAPALLAAGFALARPRWTLYGVGFVNSFPGLLALQNGVQAAPVNVLNAAIAQCLGTFIAIACIIIFRAARLPHSTRRLLRQGDAELRARLATDSTRTLAAWSFSMLDRIAFLSPRFAYLGQNGAQAFNHILNNVRVGIAIAEIQAFRKILSPGEGRAVDLVLARVDRHLQDREDAQAKDRLDKAFATLLRTANAVPPELVRLQLLVSFATLRYSLSPT